LADEYDASARFFSMLRWWENDNNARIKTRHLFRKSPTKKPIYIRFSPEVVDYFRATGKGWQTRMDEALKEWIREHKNA